MLLIQRSTRPTTRGRNPARVVLALIVAIIWPSAQILASLHEVSVRHVVCDEHGEVAHVSAPEQGSPAPASSAGTTTTVRDQASATTHEHCPHAGILHRHKSLEAPKQGVAPALALNAGVGEPARYIAPGTRLLLSAPKTSPPLA
jgi:hypothetical protein